MIRLNRDAIPMTLAKYKKEILQRAILIAQRYLNTNQAIGAFTKFGTELRELVKKGPTVRF